MKNIKLVCSACKVETEHDKAKENLYICPNCNKYLRVSAMDRIEMIADEGTFESFADDLISGNPLEIPGYEEKLQKARETTGLNEGVIVGKCKIYENECIIGAIDSRFMMGSMGSIVGEKITLAVEEATKKRLPVVLFCCSGGARMQEGILSLMQMEKTSAALKKHSEAGNLYVSVCTDPTTGGVTASFAMLGDIILSEPKAMIGFAGPRVIEQTIGKQLPEGFQRAEFQLEHGFVDAIVERYQLKDTIGNILSYHPKSRSKIVKSVELAGKQMQIFKKMSATLAHETKEANDAAEGPVKNPLSAWEKVVAVRKPTRLGAREYISALFDGFIELHGDRYFRDDPSIVGGIATFNGIPVTIIGIDRGHELNEMMRANFGMPSPEGYRKGIRLMKQAEKFDRPVITFVNTSGAYPGKEAEENGQGEAIARSIFEMSGLKIPTLSIMLGEGGSGGALALAVGNEVWMMENAIYSILSPEGFASILWKDGNRAQEAASVMKITAQDLNKLGVVDAIIPEFGGAEMETLDKISDHLREKIAYFLDVTSRKSGETLAQERYNRFRAF
ncbi:MAG: acetyl-CoA carboxylase, carboxyltransferase subunit beta [Treponema sp.]|nr:acetyl-CoA carboxylase, carboxyltransferase subunit beta [Treponema sp.]